MATALPGLFEKLPSIRRLARRVHGFKEKRNQLVPIHERILRHWALIWLTVVKRKIWFLPNCFSVVLVVVISQCTDRGGTHVATVDHSDIRGLVTA